MPASSPSSEEDTPVVSGSSIHPGASPLRYPIPKGQWRVEEVILRSRFITTLDRVTTVEEAKARIAQVRAEFPDASHHCFAYVLGPPGSTASIGLGDDGEPHGTAGRPMLQVLLHSGVGDICAVVTRYFGGTLLGRGGLVRAYSGGVQLGLASMPRDEHLELARLQVVIDYSHITPFQRLLPTQEAEIVETSYSADASFLVQLPREHVESFCQTLTELTFGQVLLEEVSLEGKAAARGVG